MKKLLAIFASNHILTNFLVIAVFIGAFWVWGRIPKEQMPETTMDLIIVSASYLGASPGEVEFFVTREIENAVKGIEGVKYVVSTTGTGFCSVYIELEYGYNDYDGAVDEVESAVSRIRFPEEMEDDPVVREIKSTNRTIMRVSIFQKDEPLLSEKGRQQVQDAAYSLENQLLALGVVREISRHSYLEEEVSITVDPDKLALYDLSYNTVTSALISQNVRQPVGQIEAEDSAKVTVYAELDDVEKIKKAVIRSSFSGKLLRVEDVAHVVTDFEVLSGITKLDGQESVTLTIRKSSTAGILEACDEARRVIENYFATSQKDSTLGYKILGDDSISVRDRLDLIGSNGVMGFFIIFVLLLLLLNFKSGIWVAMGIPFSVALSLIIMYFAGFSINNMSLAGVIIVLGMLVDDAIVIAENITRREEMGEPVALAVVNGTATMIRPVLASSLTTCAAFIPLLFFSGYTGKMIAVIPLVVFFMLAASFLESLVVLPSHMNLHFPWRRKNGLGLPLKKKKGGHWFLKVERVYGIGLQKIIKVRCLIYLFFIGLLVGSIFLYVKTMRFEQFPREETTMVFISGGIKEGSDRFETERAVRVLESILDGISEGNIEMYESRIGTNRRGGNAHQNVFSIFIELFPQKDRDLSLEEFETELETAFEPIKKDFNDLRIVKQRFSPNSDDFSPLIIEIMENDDEKREAIAALLVERLKENPSVGDVEMDTPLKKIQYQVGLERDLIQRLNINANEIGSVLRTVITGSTLFYHYRGDVEIPVKVTVDPRYQQSLETLLELPVSNRGSYLVPLSEVVTVTKTEELEYITRLDEKRVLAVYGELAPDAKDSPVEIAEWAEATIFPDILAKYPTALFRWEGEVKSTRESSGDFMWGMIWVVFLIYFILSVLFQSLFKPFLIMVSIPFGIIGVILALAAHGIMVLGMFTLIGILGLAGVVVNDSIMMLSMLQEHADDERYGSTLLERVTRVSSTRLRAVILTTVTTVAGLLPTAYGVLGYDSMLSDMMLAMSWGLIFGTLITLVLIPLLYYSSRKAGDFFQRIFGRMGFEVNQGHQIHDDIEISDKYKEE